MIFLDRLEIELYKLYLNIIICLISKDFSSHNIESYYFIID